MAPTWTPSAREVYKGLELVKHALLLRVRSQQRGHRRRRGAKAGPGDVQRLYLALGVLGAFATHIRVGADGGAPIRGGWTAGAG
jgi:hypothetical protein